MNFLLETMRLGFSNLRLHKLRSLLTALGIIIGVAVVIIVVAAGEGSKRKALAAISQLGARNVIVRSVKPAENFAPSAQSASGFVIQYGLQRSDLRRIQDTIGPVERIVPLKHVGSSISLAARRSPGEVFGTTPDLLRVTSLQVERGRYLADEDLDRLTNVAVIGSEVARRLFPLEDPLGKSIRIASRENLQLFEVVGVLRPVGLAGGAGSALVGRDLNFDVHIPLTTAAARFGDTNIKRQSGSMTGETVELSELYVQIPHEDQVLAVARNIERLLETQHKEKADVTTIVPLELLEKARRDKAMFNALMIVIAAVSLLVGGIGIMNIMLASVTERTREIGIRRAFGATRRHIVSQFLAETTMLATVGGVLGVAVGVTAAPVLAWLGKSLPQLAELGQPIVTLLPVLVSVIVATLVGIIAGLYPAIKAAYQDPIVALRHD